MSDRTNFWDGRALPAWSRFVDWLSGEWLLKVRPNGGDVILLRATWASSWLWLTAIAISQSLDPTRHLLLFSGKELLAAMTSGLPWLGTFFAGIYAALYARFASQWGYLADVYNQVKAAEARLDDTASERQLHAIVQWKAGYIEDAEDLHLATKPPIATTILHWLRDEKVREAFVTYASGNRARLCQLTPKLERAKARHAQTFDPQPADLPAIEGELPQQVKYFAGSGAQHQADREPQRAGSRQVEASGVSHF